MNDEPREDPARVVKLGGKTYLIAPADEGRYELRDSQGTVLMARFSAEEAQQLEQMLREVREADTSQ